MNDDASTFNIPEYIESRLKPILPVEFPSDTELRQIISYHVPYVPESLVEGIITYLREQKERGNLVSYSIRDAIQIARYAPKCGDPREIDLDTVAPRIVKLHEQNLSKKVFSLLDT
jgi:MoxR-like ATPase